MYAHVDRNVQMYMYFSKKYTYMYMYVCYTSAEVLQISYNYTATIYMDIM